VCKEVFFALCSDTHDAIFGGVPVFDVHETP
jgi:hypothetical protein